MSTPPITSAVPMRSDADVGLPAPLHALVQRELDDDEHVEWSGQPLPERMFWRALPQLLVGIPWTLFAMAWTGIALSGPFPFALFGMPFLAVGAYLLGSPWLERRRAREIAYVVTNHRAMILSASVDVVARGWRHRVRSFLPPFGDVERTDWGEGTGDVMFARELVGAGRGGQRTSPLGFFGVPDAARVERLMRRLALPAPREPGR